MRFELLFSSLIIAALFFAAGANAAPMINNISIQEPYLWLGETNTVFLNCTDNNSNYTISPVSADITTSTAFFPGKQFTQDASQNFFLPINTASPPYAGKTGDFNITAYCANSNNERANASVSFRVSNLSAEIKSAVSPAYVGDIEEIVIAVKKDGSAITSNVNFSIALDGTNIPFISQPYYDFSKGWVLDFDTRNQTTGTRALSINAGYNRTQAIATASISILPAITFSVTSINNSWISGSDQIMAVIKASSRGSAIPIAKESLSIQMDSTSAAINDVSPYAPIAGSYAAKFSAPSMPKGTRTLTITFSYNNTPYQYSTNLVYVLPVSGNIFSGSDKTGAVAMAFTSSSAVKTITTDSGGAYSSYLPPATYDININDGKTVLDIYGANINDFDDSIKYQPLTSATVKGIQGAGIYFLGVAFGYSSARLKIPYDQSRISDESKINAYVCKNWNSGKKECISDWVEAGSKIDTVRKSAAIDTSVLNAAYIIGSLDNAGSEASADKTAYSISDKITITGIAMDGAKNIIPGATITASIRRTQISATATSNGQGVFSLDLQNPAAEGAYTIAVDVSKPPYAGLRNEINITVAKSKDISIIVPDTIRLSPKESSGAQLRIINTGEADLSGLKISIKGIPSNYYRILPSDGIDSIKSGGEKSVTLHFDIPDDAAKATFGASIEISKGDFVRKQDFALTILLPTNTSITVSPMLEVSAKPSAINETSAQAFSFNFPTARILSEAALGDAGYIAAFAVASISAALALRKRRISQKYMHPAKNSGGRNMLFEIKNKVTESEKAREKKIKGRRFSKYVKNW